MKRLGNCFFLFLIILIFTSCSKTIDIKPEPFPVKDLTIGVIGDIPTVNEKQVRFEKIKFSDLEEGKFDKKYDVIFITKDNLSEAAQDKYASIYKKSKIPFFFIQSEKSFVPFTEEGLSYENAPKMGTNAYAVGIQYKDGKLASWEYLLGNKIQDELSIRDVYSRIFKTIYENKW